MFADLRGQFAIALWSARSQRLVLARDRFGVIPLYWSRQRRDGADWLLFASEIKALLASGLVDAAPDLKGIDQVFHFLAVPGPSTCFAGVQLLQPGHYLTVDLGAPGAPSAIHDRVFWDLDFPDSDDAASGRRSRATRRPLRRGTARRRRTALARRRAGRLVPERRRRFEPRRRDGGQAPRDTDSGVHGADCSRRGSTNHAMRRSWPNMSARGQRSFAWTMRRCRRRIQR